MFAFMTITKALADENRVRVLLALRQQELCVCQLVELLQLAPSTVSKHLAILRQARLVESRKKGRWIFYRLAGERAAREARTALDWTLRSVGDSHKIREDGRRLKEILAVDPQILCSRLNSG